MRQDQIQRLQDLSEKLADTFILEADPSEWPGNGKAPADATKEERGNAYWCKKNAMATGGVLRYTLDLISKHEGRDESDDPSREADLDVKIREAEQRAAAAVGRVLDKAKKGEFDKRTLGR